jgi:hypothetical protein
MEQRNISITLHASTSLTIGDTLHFNTFILPLSGDENSANNVDTFDVPVIASLDPNIKVAEPAGAVSPSYISSGNGWFDYTIHFQNTGTAPAEFIIINDSLSNLLDLATLDITGSSFPVVTELKYPRLLRFSFNNIMLPDSNSNEPASHGFVSYRIKSLTSLTLNDTIRNTALIYFDYNDAVVTNTTKNFIDPILNISINETYTEGNLLVFPNPSQSEIIVHWNIQVNFKDAALIIYDNNGLKINSYKIKQRGTGDLHLSASKLPSGVYMYSLIVDGKLMDFKKMVRTK